MLHISLSHLIAANPNFRLYLKTIKPGAAITFPFSYRKVEISDNDRDWKSLDA